MPQHVDPAEQAHVDRETLIAYVLDGQMPDAAILQHLAQCPWCSKELAWWRSLEQTVAANRDRQSCPPVETLQAYALHQLDDATTQATERHVSACLQCAAEISVSREFLLDDEPVAQRAGFAALAGQALRRVAAVLLAPEGAPALSLKDQTESHVQVFRADSVDVALDHEPLERGRFLLHGSLTVRAESGGGGASAPLASLTTPLAARLLRVADLAPGTTSDAAPEVVAEAPIEANGFEFDAVPAGRYQIEVLFPDRLIVVASISL